MDHTEVFLRIVDLLRKLDKESQGRVIASVQTLLDLPAAAHVPAARQSSEVGAPARTTQSSFSQDRTISAKEFVRDKDPQTDVERVARVPIGRVGDPGRIGEAGMVLEIFLPKPWSHQVRRHAPRRENE